jgi:carboxypeptidase PM20D1
MISAITKGLAYLILVLTATFLVMGATASFDPPPDEPQGLGSPVLEMEMVRSADEIHAVLRDPVGWHNREVMRLQICEDWPFIVLYWLFFLGLGVILFRCNWTGARVLGVLLVFSATAAAGGDVLEDLGILRALDADVASLDDSMAYAIRTPSLAKWGLLAGVYLAAAPLFLSYRRGPIGAGFLSTLGGVLLLLAAAFGFAGVIWNPAINVSMGCFVLFMLLMLVLSLVYPESFLAGVGAADSNEPRTFRHFRWVLIFVAVSVAVLAVIVLFRTVMLRSHGGKTSPSASVAVNEDALTRHLAGAVHIETISHPVPTEHETSQLAKLRTYLGTTYPSVRRQLRWEEPSGNLLITWDGADKNLKPLVLLAHMDVVPARGDDAAAESQDRGSLPAENVTSRAGASESRLGAVSSRSETSDWDALAFQADPEKTRPFIYGRGTLDDKISVVGILEAVEALAMEGFRPRRTLMLAFGRDEEVGSKLGARTLAKLLKERGIRADCVIDEGSYVLQNMIPGLDRPLAPIGIAEKGYVDIEMSVHAKGGHSSMPPANTAVGILSRAISRLEQNPLPARMNGVTRETIRALGPELPFLPRMLAVNGWLFDSFLAEALAHSHTMNGLVRSTAAVTLVDGGVKDNVLPQRATAIVNLRPLPGDASRQLLLYVKGTIADPRVRVGFADPRTYSDVYEASGVSHADCAAYNTLKTTIRQTFPGAVVVPYLVIAGTDSRFYENLADNVYRFLPLALDPDDLERIHGVDERITRRGLVDVVQFYYRLIRNFNS